MGCLTGTANSNITHSYNREWILLTFDDSVVKQEATNPYSYAVEPRERFQPRVDFYVIAFHVLFYAD
jgi:hypothetical protein